MTGPRFLVPSRRHNLPHRNSAILDAMLVEIHEADLPRIVEQWRHHDSRPFYSEVGEFFKRTIRDACFHKPKERVLEPYLRRPHITCHGGSSEGAPHCQEQLGAIAYQTGRLVARNGFDLWTGGGGKGLMKKYNDGFRDELEENGSRRPDQYSVQIIPAEFAVPDPEKTGPRPLNEGLARNADLIIVMPDFFIRRDMLDGGCVASIGGIGGTGTLDEGTDTIAHKKTGIWDFPYFMLNPYIPALGHSFNHHLLKQIEDYIACEFEKESIKDLFTVCEHPQQAFDILMPLLAAKGELPDQVYEKYCRRHGNAPLLPGIPRVADHRARLVA